MHIGMIKFTGNPVRHILQILIFLCLSETMSATSIPYRETEVNGIRYWAFSRVVDGPNPLPDLPDLKSLGFRLNLDDEKTFIAPDGKIIPAFSVALWAVRANRINNWYGPDPYTGPPSYSGEVYLPDSAQINYWGKLCFMYVLGFESESMADKLTALRTPLYMPVNCKALQYAVNLQKVQIGSCYAVDRYGFKNCSKLETIIFEKSPYVYPWAFADCNEIKTIVLQSEEELPMLKNAEVFPDNVYTSATLYLPDSLMDVCGSDPVWSKFVNRRSLKECTVEFMEP